MTKFDAIIDEGRDGWTLLAIKKWRQTPQEEEVRGIKKNEKRKKPQCSPHLVLPRVLVYFLEGRTKYAGKRTAP